VLAYCVLYPVKGAWNQLTLCHRTSHDFYIAIKLKKGRIQGNIITIITLHTTEYHVRTSNCGSKKS